MRFISPSHNISHKRSCYLIVFIAISLIGFLLIIKDQTAVKKIFLYSKISALVFDQTPTIEPVSKDFSVVVPRVQINLPVLADVDGFNKSEYLSALKSGVAHFKGTAKPDETGNTFIFGHSSNWKWEDGNFKDAFKNLVDVKNDDLIYIWYKQKEYKYLVYEKKVVESDDLSWLAPTPDNNLTLMTCYPIGSNQKRLIVRAR